MTIITLTVAKNAPSERAGETPRAPPWTVLGVTYRTYSCPAPLTNPSYPGPAQKLTRVIPKFDFLLDSGRAFSAGREQRSLQATDTRPVPQSRAVDNSEKPPGRPVASRVKPRQKRGPFR